EYGALAAQVDSAATDFLFLNGDIVSAGNYVADTLVRYELEPLGTLAAGLPVLFARGNHEGRGNNPQLVFDIFPNSDPAPFYYTFRHGPVAFIVFDAGETGRKRSILYSGGPVYEDYLAAQIEWAREAMQEPLFSSAPVKICLAHVPMIDHPNKEDYLLQRWVNVNFVPMLDEAGVDLMIGADLHEFMYCEPGTMGNPFPILVNDDVRRLDCSYRSRKLTLTTFNEAGVSEFSKVLELE
ncbi:MAG: metallophosphoesterase, partial [Bacteroidales bacterium]|nr:metallophosphoesterase [Bacteroidales bacterium]